MPVPLRKFYAQKLIDAKKKESKSYEDAKNNQSNTTEITPRSY
jgi:hypothetical protein